MKKKIVSVNFDLPNDEVTVLSARSSQSLFDADIVIYRPSIMSVSHHTKNAGKPLIPDDKFSEVNGELRKWRDELKNVCEHGRTVFVYLSRFEEKYYKDKKKSFLDDPIPISNYDSLPLKLAGMVPRGGTEMRLVNNSRLISSYWEEFGLLSEYKIYFDSVNEGNLITTKNGEKSVSCVFRIGSGNLVLLPYLNIYGSEYRVENLETGEWEWTPLAKQVGRKLVKSLVQITKSLNSVVQKSPTPDWVAGREYSFNREIVLQDKIKEQERKISEIKDEINRCEQELEDYSNLRGLLFETGHELENAILEALRLLNFRAELFADNQSEFDAIFSSPEGRFLGEDEGKDNSSINIDKLRQLETNILEDFERDEVNVHAKGVLFGNAYRLKPLHERGDFFTVKCLQGAERNGVALVRTPDLFVVAKYLKENDDEEFARKCREALLQATGKIVIFPNIPPT